MRSDGPSQHDRTAQPSREGDPPAADTGTTPDADPPTATGADPTTDAETLVVDTGEASKTEPAGPDPDAADVTDPPTADHRSRPDIQPEDALARGFAHWTHAHTKGRGPDTEGKTLHLPVAFKGFVSPEKSAPTDGPPDETDSKDPPTPVAVAAALTTTVTTPVDQAATPSDAPIAVSSAPGGKLAAPTVTPQAIDPDVPAQSAAPANVAGEQTLPNVKTDAATQQSDDQPAQIAGLRAYAGERAPARSPAPSDLRRQSADGTQTGEPAQTIGPTEPDARVHERPGAPGPHQHTADTSRSARAGDLALHLKTDAAMTDPAGAARPTLDTPTQLAQPPHPLQLVDRAHPAMPAPAQAPAPAANTPIPVAGLAVEIAARAQAGRHRFEIRLDPPELGRIDVRLDIDHHGHVTSRLVVDRAETLDLLRRDASDLERALQQAGLKTSDNGLQFALRDQGQASRDQTDGPPTDTAGVIVPDTSATPEPIPAAYAHALLRIDGIDIRV